FRQAKQQLRRHRTLVALDQVDVARRDFQPLGHLGLRQPELLADAPEAGADEQFFCGFRGHGLLQKSRHARAKARSASSRRCCGHPRLALLAAPQTWMAGTSAAMTAREQSSAFLGDQRASGPSAFEPSGLLAALW